jgi:hypothetical protein
VPTVGLEQRDDATARRADSRSETGPPYAARATGSGRWS